MSTRRNQIVNEITMLEESIKTSTERIELLKNELSNTIPDLLDRDPESERDEAIKRKNQYLMDSGFLPKR